MTDPSPRPGPSAPRVEGTSGYGLPAGVDIRGVDVASMSRADQIDLLRAILEQKIHGIAFSPYVDGQEPGDEIGEAQIRERLSIVEPYVRWIRTFSSIEGHEHIPRIARECGIRTMVGVDLGPDLDMNERQLAAGLEIAQAGHADILAVGNENMLREDLTEAQLVGYIERAKAAVPDDVPVSFVDAYYLFEQHPAVTEAVDVLLVNCYPYWESCPAEYALLYMKEMHRRAVKVANGKKVIISETGWPTSGTPFYAAEPGMQNAIEYFVRTYQWAEEDGIEIFYFAAFDEAWKVGAEGDVGAFWGLWDQDGVLKYGS
ncbi:MAG: glycosyl hydrolase family 17 protein [Bacteroidota bacterium]